MGGAPKLSWVNLPIPSSFARSKGENKHLQAPQSVSNNADCVAFALPAQHSGELQEKGLIRTRKVRPEL